MEKKLYNAMVNYTAAISNKKSATDVLFAFIHVCNQTDKTFNEFDFTVKVNARRKVNGYLPIF